MIVPTKVVESVHSNAAGIAGLILTTWVLVTKIGEGGDDVLPAVEEAVR